MRTFIAIELPKEIKDFLSRIQEKLKSSGADVKWVKPDNIHLTLKFLGEVDEEKLAKVILILDESAKCYSSFFIRLSSLGAFPKISFPRVIWIGIDKGDAQTRQIAKALDENIKKIGILPEDRPFSSHLTIGRLRSNLNRERLIRVLNNLADNLGQEIPEFQVNRIVLFKSTLTPKGPIYEILHPANLKTT